MTNDAFIELHRRDDVRSLALKKAPEGVDLKFCLQQIEGWQLACRKLPLWAATQGVLFPPRISMEQCSSQHTAEYKARVIERLFPEVEQRGAFADLTGGFGVDFTLLAPLFQKSIYVEQNEELCRLAKHNIPLMFQRIMKVSPFNILHSAIMPKGEFSLLFLDPSRRDVAGRRVVALEDCSPNVATLQEELLERADWVMIKLSPMLDITEMLRRLRYVAEVHVVGVEGECKELLLLLSAHHKGAISVHSMNLGVMKEPFVCDYSARQLSPKVLPTGTMMNGGWIHEPDACILKAGVQEALAQRFKVEKLHAKSNLYFSPDPLQGAKGLYRSFHINGVSDFSKQSIRELTGDLRQANLTIRNFPSSVAELRHRLHLAEGGQVYLFATTDNTGRHILIRTEIE